MIAGLDFTATPSLNEPQPYGPCIVAVTDEEAFEIEWRKIFVVHEISADEIKGHNSSEGVLLASLRVVRAMKAKVALLLLDKSRSLSGASTLPAPATLRMEMGCALMEKFLAAQAVSRLLCDEDFKGRADQAAFRTEVLRIHRRVRPGSKMKVGFRPSQKSTLIQAADVVAYLASRYFRKAKLTSELTHVFETLREENGVAMEFVSEWRKNDLRP